MKIAQRFLLLFLIVVGLGVLGGIGCRLVTRPAGVYDPTGQLVDGTYDLASGTKTPDGSVHLPGGTLVYLPAEDGVLNQAEIITSRAADGGVPYAGIAHTLLTVILGAGAFIFAKKNAAKQVVIDSSVPATQAAAVMVHNDNTPPDVTMAQSIVAIAGEASKLMAAYQTQKQKV